MERDIVVNPMPVIVISGISMTQCDGDADYNFTYSPSAGGTGTLTGDGVTDLGAGNATFSPASAGLGYHDIQYTFTTVNGCTSTELIEDVRVGTDIRLTGLNSNYCANSGIITFNYSHWDPDLINPPALPHTLVLTDLLGNPVAGIADLGDGDATFDPSIGVGNYILTYEYTDDLTCVNTIQHSINILPTPNANFSGLAANYCMGDGDVTLVGSPNIVNPFTESGIFTTSGPAASLLDHGNGTATFKPSEITTTGTYTITYTFQGSSGCSDFEEKTFDINPLPTVYALTGSGSYCASPGTGLTVTLFDSDAGVDYQIYRNGIADGAMVPGTGNAIQWLNKLAGTYTVVATNASGCSQTMSGSAVITENPVVTLTSLPSDVEVCEGNSAVFTITASGQNLTYSWAKNGAPVGTNSNVLTLNGPTVAGDDGSQIICTVNSSCGAAVSSPAVTLTVNSTTSVTTPPSDFTACTGTSHSFTVVATGSNNTFVWKKGGVTISNTAGKYENATTNSLTILNINSADAGTYTCHIQGDCGVEVQTGASLTVDAPIVITTQPVSISNACLGSNVAFSLAATGTNLTY
jgi:hypothetical protein